MSASGLQALVNLGLTQLEAQVYTFLLSESPATGYRIATGLGKPVANTYKAIETLATKGAIVVDDGKSRLCRAVSPGELLGRFERTFKSHKDRALHALSEVQESRADDRVYQLKSPEQVFERARHMLTEAREIVLADLFPAVLPHVQEDLQAAAKRGLRVAAKVYQPVTLTGVDVSVDPDGSDTVQRWPGCWLNLVTDGAQHLLAFLNPDLTLVHQAVWSGSAYLSWVYHCAFGAEAALASVTQKLQAGQSSREILAWIKANQRNSGKDAPGYQALLSRFEHASGHRS